MIIKFIYKIINVNEIIFSFPVLSFLFTFEPIFFISSYTLSNNIWVWLKRFNLIVYNARDESYVFYLSNANKTLLRYPYFSNGFSHLFYGAVKMLYWYTLRCICILKLLLGQMPIINHLGDHHLLQFYL